MAVSPGHTVICARALTALTLCAPLLVIRPVLCPDIEADVDVSSAEYPVAKWGYKVLVLNWIGFFVNLVGAGAYAHAGTLNDGKFNYLGLAVVFIIFGMPVNDKHAFRGVTV